MVNSLYFVASFWVIFQLMGKGLWIIREAERTWLSPWCHCFVLCCLLLALWPAVLTLTTSSRELESFLDRWQSDYIISTHFFQTQGLLKSHHFTSLNLFRVVSKYYRRGGLDNRYLFITVLEAGKTNCFNYYIVGIFPL